jgi:8-oxo-dGTP diphosphatase
LSDSEKYKGSPVTDRPETEVEYLDRYIREERGKYPKAAHTVDVALFSVETDRTSLLLIKRGNHPFKGKWALPGGFVDVGSGNVGEGEDLDEAASRELAEETGVTLELSDLVQLKTYGNPMRDPRGRVFSTVFVAAISDLPEPRHGDDAADAHFLTLEEVEKLSPSEFAFDHEAVVRDAVGWLISKSG